MSLLQQIAVSFSPTKPAHFHMEREGLGQLSEHTTAVQPHWILWPDLRMVFSHVIHCCPQHPLILTTKCDIENDVDGMPQWISRELFTGSCKKYEDLKEKQVLVFF